MAELMVVARSKGGHPMLRKMLVFMTFLVIAMEFLAHSPRPGQAAPLPAREQRSDRWWQGDFKPCGPNSNCPEPDDPLPSPKTPTPVPTPVPQTIGEKYRSLGSENGFLGAPIIPESPAPDGVGRYRHYEHGSIYWSPSTGPHEVHGSIRDKWAALGWEQSFLGYPTSDQTRTTDRVGGFSAFQRGSIYWSPDTGAHEVHGAIRARWSALGWERSYLGYPITDELGTADGLGRYSQYQNGLIYWTDQEGALDAPKPIQNISLVREQSSSEVYFVIGDSKLWIPSAEEFQAAGFTWDKVQVVPDGALRRYRPQLFSAPPKTKASDVYFDCPDGWREGPKGWQLWTYNCKSKENIIRRDVVVAGWLTKDPWVSRAEAGVEDMHYDFVPDPMFIARVYGPGGLSGALAAAEYPGNPAVPDNRLPLADRAPDGSSLGITYNSLALPYSGWYELHSELNAWHVNTTGCFLPPLFPAGNCINPYLYGVHFIGKGPAPAGWHKMSFPINVPPEVQYQDEVYFPFDVFNPDQQSVPMHAGDYVVVRGTLWQDGSHPDFEEGSPVPTEWDFGVTHGHDGWTEIHPVDWIVRVKDPGPPVWKSARREAAAAAPGKTTSISSYVHASHSDGYYEHPALPKFWVPGYANRIFTTYDVQEWIDGRITDRSANSIHEITTSSSDVHIRVDVTGRTPELPGAFKASYIVTWKESDIHDVLWADDDVPAGATAAGDVEAWSWQREPTNYGKPLCGNRALQSGSTMGPHQLYFAGATRRLLVNPGDALLAYVYLEPQDIPYEIMLQWNDGSWDHRAYWGADLIPWGVNGTASRRYMGPIDVVGEWIRLEVPADLVGLEGKWLNGMAFTLFGGAATWDCAGKWTNGERLIVNVSPSPLKLNGNPVRLRVDVLDTTTGLPVKSGIVRIKNFDRYGNSVYSDHPLNAPFWFTFLGKRMIDPQTHEPYIAEQPSAEVRVPGIPAVDIDFGFIAP